LFKNFRSFKRFEKSLSFTEESLMSKLKDFRSGQSKRQFQQSLQSGDYQNAIDVYRTALKAYPDDRAFTVEYAKSVEKIRSIGDAALAKENYALAGKVYYVLEKNLSSFGGIEKKLSFNKEGLKERIAGCRSALTKRGLEQYRRGDLTGAIATWKTVLVFDPDNADIKKSINTASVQLKKLEQKK
jgi:tetratricopeptide (TPR) repeat protein